MKRLLPLLVLVAISGCAALHPSAFTADSGGVAPHYHTRFASGGSAQQTIYCNVNTLSACNTISNPGNGSQGDPAWVAFGKANANFTQIYDMFGSASHLATSGSADAADIVGLFSGCSSSDPALGYQGSCVSGGGGSSAFSSVLSGTNAQISAPTQGTPATATTGGSLPASTTYYFAITATNANGQTTISGVQSIATGSATSTNTVTPTWTDVTGAISYTVWMSTSTITGGESSVAYSTASSSATSLTIGTVPTTTATTPSANTTGSAMLVGTGSSFGPTGSGNVTANLFTGTSAPNLASANGSTVPASAGTLPGSTGTFTLNDCFEVGSVSPLEVKDAGAACGSGMVYPSAGIAVSTGSAWGTPINGGSNTLVGNAGSGQGALTPSQAIGVLNSTAANAQTGTTYTFALADENGEVTMSNAGANTITIPPAPISAPTNGALTATAGGTLSATTYYVRSTWVTSSGETLGATETSLAVAVDNVLNVAAPASPPAAATGWNVYVSTTSGAYTTGKQNSTAIGLTTAWVEPTTGLISGSALSATDTSGVTYPVGTLLTAQETGAGVTTLGPGSGVTITSAAYGSSTSQTYSLGGIYGFIQVQQTATNTWGVVGWDTPADGALSKAGTTPSLVNGTGISITGTWPNQTVTATGGGGGSTFLNVPTTVTSATAATVVSFSASANTAYYVICYLSGNATTGGSVEVDFTGPTSPTSVTYALASNVASSPATAYGTFIALTTGTAEVHFFPLWFNLQNGSTAGTVTLQVANSVGGSDTGTIYAGSFCKVN